MCSVFTAVRDPHAKLASHPNYMIGKEKETVATPGKPTLSEQTS